MFTGIVQGIAEVESVEGSDELLTFTIQFPENFCRDLTRGASVSVNGVCLTATHEVAKDKWDLDVMLKSLTVTNLRGVQKGHLVNVERAAKEGAEIGGHPLSGHVDFMAEIIGVIASEGNKLIRFAIPETAVPYVFSQGYIAIDGASLTIADLSKTDRWIEVWLIPETRRSTILDKLSAGDHVNVEIDRGTQVVVDTIKNTIEEALEKKFPHLEAALLKLGVSANDLLDDVDTPKLIQHITCKARDLI